ncbi:MAG: NAD(P)/FAD-dependent oxidoreductase [Rhodoferax sp.]|nr:MAG: NAD(P)/FAD-dependent oxidoreductase [Rhodoferax sp.]
MSSTSTPTDSVFDVVIVGAGLSGIGAARHLQKHSPQLRFAVLESRQCMGGTWDLFRYPGIRSDSDMHTLGYNFKPWVERKAIADGGSILRYIQGTAAETGIDAHIRYDQRVQAAHWSAREALWTLEIAHPNGGASSTLKTRFLYLCSGYYSYAQGYSPTFAQEDSFTGPVVHPQFWPKDLDYRGKKVVVIGSGATAVTLVPEMAKQAALVTMLQRSPGYVIDRPGEDRLALELDQHLPSGLAYGLTRWKNVLLGMLFFRLARKRPAMVRRYIMNMTAKELGPGTDMRHFTPAYAPWDQRLCAVPDGDLFHSLRAGKAQVVTDHIDHFTPDGIALASGGHLPADVIVKATGLQLEVLGGIRFTLDGQPFAVPQALAYKGMMLAGLPNAFMAFGYTNASWTLKADLTADWVCRTLNHMQRHNFRSVTPQAPSQVRAEPFMALQSGYVQRAQHLLPRQGDRNPWRVHQNYLADLLAIRFGRLHDGALQFQ